MASGADVEIFTKTIEPVLKDTIERETIHQLTNESYKTSAGLVHSDDITIINREPMISRSGKMIVFAIVIVLIALVIHHYFREEVDKSDFAKAYIPQLKSTLVDKKKGRFIFVKTDGIVSNINIISKDLNKKVHLGALKKSDNTYSLDIGTDIPIDSILIDSALTSGNGSVMVRNSIGTLVWSGVLQNKPHQKMEL
jgi:hypothetical protein